MNTFLCMIPRAHLRAGGTPILCRYCVLLVSGTLLSISFYSDISHGDSVRELATTTEPERPNFLVIVADDLGFSDLGFAGSEIHTPNLDQLADEGSVFTQFYTAPTCSPTRSMLLSGVDHHRTGLGSMHEIVSDELRQNPGYEGHLNDRVSHLPTLLRQSGYFNFIAGKWHLGLTEQQSPKARGFDRSFVLLNGGASHFSDQAGLFEAAPVATYRANGVIVNTLPDDFYSSRFFADRAIEWISEAQGLERPFFGYLAYTAPHWPLQAPDSYLDRYAGEYDDGYDTLRRQRLMAMQEAGFIHEGVPLPPALAFVPDWQTLSDEERQRQSRYMELYAAMVESMDANLGRVLTHLRNTGLLDNTWVLFFSDNGPEGTDALTVLGNESWVPRRFNNAADNLGRVNSYASVGPGWAQASATPFQLFKSFVAEGGIRSPAILLAPPERRQPSRINATVSVADIFPTILALSGNINPNQLDERVMTGHSWLPYLDSREWPHHTERTLAWELFGRAAVRQGHWKAMKQQPPAGSGQWQLFDLSRDPAETNDQAEEQPQVLKRLIALWETYARDNGVIVLDQDVGYGKR